MSRQNEILVFLEQDNGKIAPVSIELICEAHRLAGRLKAGVCGVVPGDGLEPELEKLGRYGCGTVYYVEDKRLAHFTACPYAKIITRIIKKTGPRIVLFGATTTGRAVAPRVASALGCGLTADCTALGIGDFTARGKVYTDILHQIRPAFGGNIIATIVSPESFPSMATVREGVMKISVLENPLDVEIIREPALLDETDFPTEVLETVSEEKTVNLKGAKIIVSAGMGASHSAALQLVRELAVTLGAELGSSRPLVDAGILPKVRQVGQTGTTVRPNLYIACGISGQVQHRAGMFEAKRIIAINQDKEAPIFQFAHYGIVGDLNEVIPEMIRAYKDKV